MWACVGIFFQSCSEKIKLCNGILKQENTASPQRERETEWELLRDATNSGIPRRLYQADLVTWKFFNASQDDWFSFHASCCSFSVEVSEQISRLKFLSRKRRAPKCGMKCYCTEGIRWEINKCLFLHTSGRQGMNFIYCDRDQLVFDPLSSFLRGAS